jgi:peptidyl-dipeptidase Dcp
MRFLKPLLCLSSVLLGLGSLSAQHNNPLLTKWNTPFGMPPFDLIKDEDFLPAFAVAISEKKAELASITENPAAPTFANTIEALDNSGLLLARIDGVFGNLNSAEANEQRQAIAKEIAPKLAALSDDMRLNAKLFARVRLLWQARASLGLDPAQAKLLEETYKHFIRGGANLDNAGQARMRAINAELSVLGVSFNENLLKETNSFKLFIDRKEDLDGLPDRVVKSAAAAAEKAGQPGKWLFTLHAPSLWPFLENASNRVLRKRMLDAYAARCSHENGSDNRTVIVRIATLRAERAALLGYKTHADYVLEERMAKNSSNVYALLNQVWAPSLAMARKEAQAMQDVIKSEGGNFALEASDWQYYASKVRKARYDFDENEVRPYFALDNVREGAFTVANKLYGITFTERKDLPVYHPDVRVFEVKDADGSHLGLFMTDYFSRPAKRGGAWMNNFRLLHREDGQLIHPIVINVCNFARPIGTDPCLLSVDEAETLFHEFGHALHYLFSRVPYTGLSRVSRDFVELPSQIMENWVLEPETLKLFARHYKTGELIPDSLVQKVVRAQKFNQGFKTVEYTAASLLDLDWATIKPGEQIPDAGAFEKASMDKIGLMPEILPRYRSAYFLHIWYHGYDAGYYGYLWCEVLDADAFQAFKENGLFDRSTATRFRNEILSRGNSGDLGDMYRNFRGHDPEVNPLLKRRGLSPE